MLTSEACTSVIRARVTEKNQKRREKALKCLRRNDLERAQIARSEE